MRTVGVIIIALLIIFVLYKVMFKPEPAPQPAPAAATAQSAAQTQTAQTNQKTEVQATASDPAVSSSPIKNTVWAKKIDKIYSEHNKATNNAIGK